MQSLTMAHLPPAAATLLPLAITVVSLLAPPEATADDTEPRTLGDTAVFAGPTVQYWDFIGGGGVQGGVTVHIDERFAADVRGGLHTDGNTLHIGARYQHSFGASTLAAGPQIGLVWLDRLFAPDEPQVMFTLRAGYEYLTQMGLFFGFDTAGSVLPFLFDPPYLIIPEATVKVGWQF